ncbi:unnamed protein product [Ectocarpus sp. 6 AP-2014]
MYNSPEGSASFPSKKAGGGGCWHDCCQHLTRRSTTKCVMKILVSSSLRVDTKDLAAFTLTIHRIFTALYNMACFRYTTSAGHLDNTFTPAHISNSTRESAKLLYSHLQQSGSACRILQDPRS